MSQRIEPFRLSALEKQLLDDRLEYIDKLNTQIREATGVSAIEARRELPDAWAAFAMMRAEIMIALAKRIQDHYAIYGTAEVFIEERFSRTSDCEAVGSSINVPGAERFIVVPKQGDSN